MKKNMGSADRIIRMVTAAVFVALSLTGIVTGTMAVILPIAGVFLGITSNAGFCPLYIPFGFTTLKDQKQEMGDGIN